MNHDATQVLQSQIQAAAATKTPLDIHGGNSKHFLGRRVDGEPLSTARHRGVINYEPGELILTARSGTLLKDIRSLLDEHNQMLAFEPPALSSKATLGGTIACGLSGPRRPYAGAARDFVLGTRLINGKGDIMRFGGEVMKNVAGYDISRLMTGAYGTLGVMLDISLKIMPKPEVEQTRVFAYDAPAAIHSMNHLAGQPVPLTGACYHEGKLYLRLSGVEAAVSAAARMLGGETLAAADEFWQKLREQQDPFFKTTQNVWRLSVPATTPVLPLNGNSLIDWGGALRWLVSDEPSQTIHQRVEEVGGHTTLYKNHDGLGEVFHPLKPGLKVLHKQLKAAFDPDDILNPGRMYLGI